MNLFLFSAVALCLASGAHGSYQQQQQAYGSSGTYNQRKMAPSPQTYGPAMSGYGQEQQAATPAYDNGQQYQASGYGQQQASYGAAKQAASSYARPASAATYGQQQASYAKAAPQYEEQYQAPMPFAWGYDINDGYGGAQFHKESGDEYGKRTGSYGYTDAYGVYRQVDYVADESGFHATIKTNEPGTANESPADVELHAYEPPSNYYAGNKDSYARQSASYGTGASGYGQQQQQSSSYGSGQQATYAAAAPATRSNYASPRASTYSSASRPQQSAYESGAQYSSSAIVPVYQKATQAARRNY